MGACESCFGTENDIIIKADLKPEEIKENNNIVLKEDFEEKYEKMIHPGETRMEKYKRKTKEYFEDLKERAINNFEHIKARLGYNNNNNNDNNLNGNEKREKLD